MEQPQKLAVTWEVHADEAPVCCTIASLERNHGTPSYEGKIEIYPVEGGFVLINELPLEQYLHYVVPSEMPSGYEKEALKAQAVCARTYAWQHMRSVAYPEYQAHVDDSVIFQVYNNTGLAESTTQAVQETAGEILVFGEEPITAYYFSTSCGYTGDVEIWWGKHAEDTPYLSGKTVDKKGRKLEMHREDVFSDFISKKQEDGYDTDYSWYRWETEISLETLSEHFNYALEVRCNANPDAIVTLDGMSAKGNIKSIGKIQGIEIIERNSGGAVEKIKIRGSKETLLIETEYNIRALLHVKDQEILRGDGSIAIGGPLLPSAYFIVEPTWKKDGSLNGFLFQGGGYGHGVGMSQNAANTMAKQGNIYEEILKFFYEGVELTMLESL